MNEFFIFYSNISIIKGFKRTLLVDMQLKKNYLISNILLDFINDDRINLSKIDSLTQESKKIIKKWLDYFIENNLGHYTNNPELFPKMSSVFYSSSQITNLVIEISKTNYEKLTTEVLPKIDKLGVKAMVIIFVDQTFDFEDFNQYFRDSGVEHIELYLPFNIYDDIKFKLISTQKRIRKITFYGLQNSKENCLYNDLIIEFLVNRVSLIKSCGNIFVSDNLINNKIIFESINHNSCLNKKLAIDKDGNIKNCPSMPESFGNIKDTTIEQALNHPNFKKYWNITKDQIEVCKDCEFRHICTDS